MKIWKIGDFAKMGDVSVRMLHHYEEINLLKPIARMDSGYRLYDEKSLLRLQQIKALQFLGFSLTRIYSLLHHQQNDFVKNLTVQIDCLYMKISNLQQVLRFSEKLLEKATVEKIDWQEILALIKVYKMDKKTLLEKYKKVYSQVELDLFDQAFLKLAPQVRAEIIAESNAIQAEVTANLDKDPASELGKELAQRWDKMFKKQYQHEPALVKLMEKKWNEQPEEVCNFFAPGVLQWIIKAYFAHGLPNPFDI